MFDHIGLGVSDYDASKQFFLKALGPLGVRIVMEGPYGLGIGPDGKPSFWLHQSSTKPAPLHLAFVAKSRALVDAGSSATANAACSAACGSSRRRRKSVAALLCSRASRGARWSACT